MIDRATEELLAHHNANDARAEREAVEKRRKEDQEAAAKEAARGKLRRDIDESRQEERAN